MFHLTALRVFGIVNRTPLLLLALASLALPRILSAQSNTAYGTNALPGNTGSDNSAFGYSALRNNTEGYGNTATGSDSLFSNTIGSRNVANGESALSSNVSGDNNVAVGAFALDNNDTATITSRLDPSLFSAIPLATTTSGSAIRRSVVLPPAFTTRQPAPTLF